MAHEGVHRDVAVATSASTSAASRSRRRSPTIGKRDRLGARPTLGNIWAAYLIAYAIGQFLASGMGTRLGPRRNVLLGMALSIGVTLAMGISLVVPCADGPGSSRQRARAGDRLVRQRRHDGGLVPQARARPRDGRVVDELHRRLARLAVRDGRRARRSRPRYGGDLAVVLLRRRVVLASSGSSSTSSSATSPRTSASRRSTIR